MNLKNAQTQVKDWMKSFGQETPENGPVIPSNEILKLRVSLIEEETNEALDFLDPRFGGLSTKSRYNLALDGLGDSLFVILGTFVALGISAEEVYNEIVRSNWTKFWTYQEVSELPDYHEYVCKEVNPSMGSERNFRAWLVKNQIGKVIKSPSYSPPDLSKFLPKELK